MTDKKIIKSSDIERSDRLPPGQHKTGKWPVLHVGRIPWIKKAEWSFKITGLVEEEKTLDFEQFEKLSMERVESDIHCVTTWSKFDNLWEGVGGKIIVELANIRPNAKYVMIHSYGGYSTNIPLKDFVDDDVLFAVKQNGEDLSPEHGYPVRLVVPKLYFWKSAKWVNGIEFMAKDKPGFWEAKGYHNRGNPWKEERYSD